MFAETLSMETRQDIIDIFSDNVGVNTTEKPPEALERLDKLFRSHRNVVRFLATTVEHDFDEGIIDRYEQLACKLGNNTANTREINQLDMFARGVAQKYNPSVYLALYTRWQESQFIDIMARLRSTS